jgi:hypothetical protein
LPVTIVYLHVTHDLQRQKNRFKRNCNQIVEELAGADQIITKLLFRHFIGPRVKSIFQPVKLRNQLNLVLFILAHLDRHQVRQFIFELQVVLF